MRIKGFDENLCCRGMQFKIGETYDTGAKDDEIKLCTDTVFHYCDSAQKVHKHYPFNYNNRFCEIEVLGAEISDFEKMGSNRIRIIREINGDELDCLIGKANNNTGVFNTGDWNTGDRNTGSFNSCDFSSGVFCTEEENIRIFNKPTNMTGTDFYKSSYWNALNSSSFILTEWIKYKEEEIDTKEKEMIGGYLKKYTYKEACKNWWANMADKNKEIVKSMPNFDKNIFFEITGIEVE